jgi:hypothetical protein
MVPFLGGAKNRYFLGAAKKDVNLIRCQSLLGFVGQQAIDKR